jgi:hypothetical protein
VDFLGFSFLLTFQKHLYSMKPVEFPYQNQTIHFLLSSSDDNVMVNATEMANIFGKKVDNYLRLESTKILIEKLKNENFAPSDVREQKVIYATNKATFMHRILALDFAAWLDVDFKIWIYQIIEKILFGYYKEHWDAHILQEKSKAKMEEYKRKLLLDATAENAIAYFEAEETYKGAKAKKQKAISNQYKLL